MELLTTEGRVILQVNIYQDIETYIYYRYHIAIERRKNVDRFKRRKMNQYRSNDDIRIFTYDKFLDIAQNFDDRDSNPYSDIPLNRAEE